MAAPPDAVWTLAPNWRVNYVVTYEFRTDVFTSRSGREQRRALRTTPRKQVKFTVTRTEQEARAYSRFLTLNQGALLSVADYSRHATVREPVPSGATVLAITGAAPTWLAEGARVFLGGTVRLEVAAINSESGTVSLVAPLAQSWPEGVKIYPSLDGRLIDTISTENHGRRTIESEVTIAVEPATGAVADDAGTPDEFFNAREVLIFSPNFAHAIPSQFTRVVDKADFERGRVATYLPVNFSTRTKTYQVLSPNRHDRERLLGLFLRMKGQRGEFYIPTYEDDFTLVVPAVALANSATFAGTDLHAIYQANDVHRAIAIKTPEHTFYRRIIGTSTDGVNTTIVTDTGWPVPIDQVVQVSWLLVHRLATDQMVLTCVTDEVSQFQFAVTSLEDIAVAGVDRTPQAGEIDEAAEWVIANWGKGFFVNKGDSFDGLVNNLYPYVANSDGLAMLTEVASDLSYNIEDYRVLTIGGVRYT